MTERLVTGRLITSSVETDSYDEHAIETVLAGCSAMRAARLIEAERVGLTWSESTIRFACACSDEELAAFLRASGIVEATHPMARDVDDEAAAAKHPMSREVDDEEQTLKNIAMATDPDAPRDPKAAAERLRARMKSCKAPSSKVDRASLRANGLRGAASRTTSRHDEDTHTIAARMGVDHTALVARMNAKG